MKITPFEQLICRTPAFGVNATLIENWEELKIKIQQSSTAFYDVIKNINSDELHQLDEKTKFTIWKYFNRAKFRSTPFGSFAAISLIDLSFTAAEKPVIAEEMLLHQWIDWNAKEMYPSHQLTAARYLLSNASIYFLKDEIRYIKSKDGAFELAAISRLPELITILTTCKTKTSPATILSLMQTSFGSNKRQTLHILEQLIELQLIFTDLHPNITGEDYFERLKIACPAKASNYIIANRTVLSGNFDGRLLRDLPEMIDFFTKNFSFPQVPDLNEFKQSFRRRFEQMEVNLAMVMDPEVGIGYGNLAHLQGDRFIEELKAFKAVEGEKSIRYGELQQFLLQNMITGTTIQLHEFEVETTDKAVLPNTFSLIFHLYKDQPVLAHTGGSTANALLGRFTMCNAAFEKYGNDISEIERSANPDVIFFDISYQAEKKVDNVNRRKQLYEYELPILTWSETASPLDFSDIMVAIEHNQVVLKSKKLGKRLVPRIASAYNYTRSDLAVYRFLCDVQNQGLLTSLSFSLKDFFPGLTHYPRVCFRTIIISPAMWQIPKRALDDPQYLQQWISSLGIKDYFKIGYADQSLCIHPTKEEDLLALSNYCKQQTGEVYLTEALLSEGDHIVDGNGNHYSPQYIVNYYHNNRIYEGSEVKAMEVSEPQLPGAEWLYAEIYSHPSKSNYFLEGMINDLINKHKSALKKWFYIRYNDPEPHIRLRLQLKNPAFGFLILTELEKTVALEMQQGFISDFNLRPYRKEIQRYGANRMDLVEQFFHIDSIYTLSLIKPRIDEQLMIFKTLQNVQTLFEIALENLETQILFTDGMANLFALEMHIGPKDFKKINAQFNAFKNNLPKEDSRPGKPMVEKWKSAFKAIMLRCENKTVKEKMLADLIHMHVNRLFITDQRVYETLIYHYLKRILKTRWAVLKAGQGS